MMFNEPVETLHGIGPKKKLLYEKMQINTKLDLVTYFPASYEDRRNITYIADLKEDENALVKGEVIFVANNPMKKFVKNIKIVVEDKSGTLDVFFFNAKYLANVLRKGKKYFFYGKVNRYGNKLQLIHPELIEIDKYEKEIVPVYRLAKGVSQNEIRKNIKLVLTEKIDEYLPEELVRKNGLCPLDFALKNIHFPQDKEHLKIAKYRMIYEELFVMQLGLEKTKNKKETGKIMKVDFNQFEKSFGFTFTEAQKKVINDIKKDMGSGKTMNRLLQGDVGSGKTAVAVIAMYIAIKSGYQASFMAPTEILAKQHFENLQSHFERFGINIALLTGSMKNSEKKNFLEDIKEGKVQGVIGTHALIQDRVEFKELGLVITDEQHRFGVNQRIKLGSKGINPHVLVMTATPIPRTLAVVVYGEQDVSVIDQLPEGRKKIETFHVEKKDSGEIYEKLLLEIKKGRQGYVVAPLIEESEAMEDIKSVEEVYTDLKARYKGENLKIELIHGSIKQTEKDEIMSRFYKGEIDILVATVVIEVGINVPNATVMIIENAERFGLAALHQLRGRIGRGSHSSYCYLVNNGKSDIAKRRMEIMAKSSDGFYISEMDLELRGPGEVFGTRQHGIPDASLINAIRHMDILAIAKEDAEKYKDFESEVIERRISSLFGDNFTMNL